MTMIKTIFRLFIVLLVGFAMASCSKDSTEIEIPNTDPPPVMTSEVYAGVHDTSFHYFEFAMPLDIAIVWDMQNLYGVGADSLDIDSDGAYDLTISLDLLNPDSLHLLTGFPNPFPTCALACANGLEVASYTESFPIGLGQTGTATFADRLDVDERIDSISEWQSTIKLWAENPGGEGTPPFGDWYSASSENYVALRLNETHYGWIEIDASNPKDPKIVSYAIQD